MDKDVNVSEILVKNMSKILENIEVSDVFVQQSIDNIKDLSNQVEDLDIKLEKY